MCDVEECPADNRNDSGISDDSGSTHIKATRPLVHVTVKLDHTIKMLVRRGLLLVYNGKEFVSSSEVEPTVPDGERSFSFRIAAKYAEKSRFTYSESNKDSIGYWFYVQDFVPTK